MWYESDNPSTIVRGASWRVGLWVVAIVVFVGLIAVGIWGFKVATSDTKGKGDSVIKKNDADNRIGAQQRFESLYAEVVAADQKVNIAAEALAGDPDSHIAKTNLSGTRSYCVSVVADYNAEARKYLSKDFRALDLPDQIDTTNPSTDCEINR